MTITLRATKGSALTQAELDANFTDIVNAKDASGGYPGLTLFKLNLRNAAGTFTSWLTNTATAARTWMMQDRDGTVALTDDITGGTQAGSFTTLSLANSASMGPRAPVVAGNPDRNYLTLSGRGAGAEGIGVLQLVNKNDGQINAGNIEWCDLGNTASTGFRAAYISSGSIGGAPNNLGSYITLATKTDGVAGSGTPRLTIDHVGNVQVVSPALLGYGTGAGGTVVQATNKSTTVTLNKPCGQITMNNAALAAGASVTFTLNNNLLTPLDSFIANIAGAASGGNDYRLNTYTGNTGQALITLTNQTAGPLSNALVINFAILKGVTS